MNAPSGTATARLEISGADPTGADRTMSLIVTERAAIERARLDVVKNWERRRRGLHRALHDGAQQQLLGLRLDILRAGASGLDRAAQVKRIGDIVVELDRLAHGLPISALEFDDIAGALREIASQCGLPVEVEAPQSLPTSVVVAEVLAYTASEALANALRHSDATACRLTLLIDGTTVSLAVGDNGKGGAHVIAGHGINGLQQRAANLGGRLDVQSDPSGTIVTLVVDDDHVDDPPPDRAYSELGPAWSHLTRDRLRSMIDDDRAEIEFFCGSSGLCDEHGEALAANAPPALLVVTAGGESIAIVHSDIASAIAVKSRCSAEPGLIHDGSRRARTAAALAELLSERNRLARRAAAFEAALARRLTSRPVQLLAEAQAALASAVAAPVAAGFVLQATDALREIVSVLDGARSAIDDPAASSDPFLFGLLADQAGVDLEARIVDVPAGNVGEGFAAIGEEIIVDSLAGAIVRLRVTCGSRTAVMTALLDNLPSPRALAFIEDTAMWLAGSVACEPFDDGVRLRVELPCAS